MSKSYIQKITPFIDNMRVSSNGGEEPTPTPMNAFYMGQVLQEGDIIVFNRNADWDSILTNLTYEGGRFSFSTRYNHCGWIDAYDLSVLTGGGLTGYAVSMPASHLPGEIDFVYSTVEFDMGEGITCKKGWADSVDTEGYYAMKESQNEIDGLDESLDWNGTLIGTKVE